MLIALSEIKLAGQDKVVTLKNLTELRAFICHASEDHALARRIAEMLHQNGIDTFFDEWEIQPGDIVKAGIEDGLDKCTHFIVLLTPSSHSKPWVNAEIDAGFIRKVEGKCRLIPLRAGLSIQQLTPLLQPLSSPSIDDFEEGIKTLISSIHGISAKPPLGPAPPVVSSAAGGVTDLSPAAEAIARLMIERSEHGDALDPSLEPNDLRDGIDLLDDALIDGVDELESMGLVRRHCASGDGVLGFHYITPEAALFGRLDKHLTETDPELDARRIAADLVNGVHDGNVKAIAGAYGWTPRRMNPAVNYLIESGLVETGHEIGSHPWACHWIRSTSHTRRFVRDHH